MELQEIGRRAQAAKAPLQRLTSREKDDLLRRAAAGLRAHAAAILAANAEDMDRARAAGMKAGLLDRLQLTEGRIDAMARGLEEVAALPDPVGEVLGMTKRPNGLLIGQKRVPLGVIGIIYEARPNVTADSFALTFKSGNAVILKGGSDALRANAAIVAVLRGALTEAGLPVDAVQLIESTDRAATAAFMQMDDCVDVLIPRGGRGLIQAVKRGSAIPVIETGTGNCHIYVDKDADIDMAVRILINAKTQRLGVCNAAESLVVHRDILERAMPVLGAALAQKGVEIRADEASYAVLAAAGIPDIQLVRATEEDYGAEYLDRMLSVRTADSLAAAIAHINRYNTGHSEAIITDSYQAAQTFLDEVDAAAVYVNASTRFTDGHEFGFGAEIGISTQKLHARGPMGLLALTTTKYVIYGSGQIRPDGAASSGAACH